MILSDLLGRVEGAGGARCKSCGTDDPFMYPCLQQGCPHQHPASADGEEPCPYCFESSGYVWEHGNDWESGPWSHQTNIPCQHCNGTGVYIEPSATSPHIDVEEIPF